MATRLILQALARSYELTSGVPVEFESMGGVDAARHIRTGGEADVVVLASNVMAALEGEGCILPGTTRAFARSGMSIAIPAGGERPDIRDEEAVRRAVLAAGRVCYSTGPSGDHLLQLCARWGVAADSDRLLKAPPGVPVGSLVAEGQADLGFQQLSELIHVPGVEVVGPLPPDIQAVTVFSAGVCSRSSRPEQARDLIAFMASPAADLVKRQEGMEGPSAEPS